MTMMKNQERQVVLLLLLLQLLVGLWNNVAGASANNINPVAPMKRFSKRVWNKISGKNSQYTPLVFFRVPPGLVPEVDAMERAVQKVEDELNVRVERLDILRNPASNAALAVLTSRTPPFLYHRESLQVVHIPPVTTTTAGAGDKADEENNTKKKKSASSIYIDQDRIRAWAQGRYLPASVQQQQQQRSESRAQKPVVLSQEDNSIDQDEILEDMALTDLQRKGKKAIAERTREQAATKE